MRKYRSFPSWVDDSEIEMTDNARKVFKERYLTKNPKGEPTGTIAKTMYRVAEAIMGPGDYRGVQTKEAYDLMANFKFLPNTPTWTGAGTELGQLSACFVLPIEDSMESIFDTLKTAALIQQSGGGVGFSFSRLRPRGSLISKSNGHATGPVGFMKVYDAAFGEIAQGGTRRGANMAVLRVDHPDIVEFIRCKQTEGELTNFNISVAVTDEFMQAVKNDDNSFPLKDPSTGMIVGGIKARLLWHWITEAAHKNGEPGVLFIDRANMDNPIPDVYTLESTNPCGEQWLGPYENCCLGSINLAKHYDKGNNTIDWAMLKDTVWISMAFLDSVITENKYIPAVPKIKEAALATRRVGLGIMGLADLFFMMGIRYGSEESQDFVVQLMEFIRFHATYQSALRAGTHGRFPLFDRSIYKGQKIWDIVCLSDPVNLHEYDFGRPELDWRDVQDGIDSYGLRNATTLTVAPTGTLATVASLEGYGCEPAFALSYTRTVQGRDGEDDMELEYCSPLLMESLAMEGGLTDWDVGEIMAVAKKFGTIQGISPMPEDIQNIFVTAGDVTPREHVRMQAAIQFWVDNSLSKTCNLPSEATVDDVSDIFKSAWDKGCKGVTVYVTGSRDKVVLETEETKMAREEGVSCIRCPSCGFVDCS